MLYLQKWVFQILALVLKAPITTAADDKFCNIFPNDSHEISCLIFFFLKKQQNFEIVVCQKYRNKTFSTSTQGIKDDSTSR